MNAAPARMPRGFAMPPTGFPVSVFPSLPGAAMDLPLVDLLSMGSATGDSATGDSVTDPTVLPQVWAMEDLGVPQVWATADAGLPDEWAMGDEWPKVAVQVSEPEAEWLVEEWWLEPNEETEFVSEPAPTAFYRRYTEAMLRRYLKMSMEAGRAPSLLGREMFRGNVTSCRVHSFEDVVIFVHDVEKCVAKLDIRLQEILERIALQEYTLEETAALLGLEERQVRRRYARALDALTVVLLATGMLKTLKCCQVPQAVQNEANGCFDWR